MSETEKVINDLNTAKLMLCNPKMLTSEMCVRIGQAINGAINLLKEQPKIVRCKDCKNWIPGYITDKDDFIPPKCGKYQQMVGHSADDYCNLAESKEGR